ncbi:male sterility protein [Xylariomycetidae sp. FL2044]|nr:male sterility protein [Xylariomycetidae sp. FL2044]
MAPIALADLESGAGHDPSVFPLPTADEKLKKLWNLNGAPHSDRYANPDLTSIAALLKHNAASQPTNPAYIYPKGGSFAVLSWVECYELVCAASNHYSPQFYAQIDQGNATGSQPTIALLGEGCGIEYFITLLALIKLRVRVLLLSNKNAPVAHRHLINECSTVGIVVDDQNSAVLDKEEIFSQRPVRMLSIDDICSLGQTGDQEPAQFETKDEWNLQSVIIHSSGSTGMPKPIVHTNRSLCLIARAYRLYPEYFIENYYLCFPLFHIGGVSVAISGLPNGLPVTFPPVRWPPAASAILSAFESLKKLNLPVDALQCAPSLVEDIHTYITSTTGDFTPLIALKVLQSGGAAFSPSVKEKLIGLGVNLKTIYGQTEIAGPLRTIPHTRENPNMFHMRNMWADTGLVQMESLGDGTFECVVYKGFHMAAELWLKEGSPNPYRTNDLFIEDPPGSGYFVLQGRKDDVVVHSNGEKTIAGGLQTELEDSDPLIAKAAVFGTNKPCTAVVIQPIPEAYSTHALDELEKRIWEAVERCNQKIPKQSRIDRSLVLILTQGESLPVTPKGNVRRATTAEMFGDRVEAMYEKYLGGLQEDEEPAQQNGYSDAEFLRRTVSDICEVPVSSVTSRTNLYDVGLESQKAVKLRSKLMKRFGQFPLMFVFENPTLEGLLAFLTKSPTTATKARATVQDQRLDWITKTIDNYEKHIDQWTSQRPPSRKLPDPNGEVVYLTGANGALGNAMIEALVQKPEVRKIYCAIRGAEVQGKLFDSLRSRGYPEALITSRKLQAVSYDMKDQKLGLTSELYDCLAEEVTIVVHNAWLLDFNKTVEQFEEDCLRGSMSLLSFCYAGRAKTFSFMSSIATCMGPATKGQTQVLETPIRADPLLATNTGYAQSKFIVERITQHYALALSMPVRLLRVGQLCGHSRLGVWNTSEMWPIMIGTGLEHLQAMPSLPPSSTVVNWLPVDVCAATSASILLAPEQQQPLYTVSNLTHPQPIDWGRYLDLISDVSMRDFERVSMADWVSRLEKLAEQDQEIPGLKLLGFFQEMAKGEGSEALEFVCERVEGLEPLNSRLVKGWFEVWRKDGFLKTA